MRKINVGDVFICKNILHGPYSRDELKQMHYAVGTCSSRPVVVIRPPYKWDRLDTVTVIECLSNGNGKSIDLLMEKEDGNTEKRIHSFIPHLSHTIPTKRLGDRIGSLTLDELKKLTDAYMWINNPFMQLDPFVPVPEIYKNMDECVKKVDRTDYITVGKNYVMKSSDQAVDGKKLQVDENCLGDKKKKAVKMMLPGLSSKPEDPKPTVAENTPKTEAKEKKKEDPKPEEPITPKVYDVTEEEIKTAIENAKNNDVTSEQVEDFLKTSVVSYNTIGELASKKHLNLVRDDIIKAMSSDDRNKPFDICGLEANIKAINATKKDLEDVWNIFKSLTRVDTYIIFPNMKVHDICKTFHKKLVVASVLKQVCRDAIAMTTNDYEIRVKKFNNNTKNPESPQKEEVPVIVDDTPEPEEVRTAEIYTAQCDRKINTDWLSVLRPYLTAGKIENIPKKLHQKFLDTPVFMLQQNYSGKQFLKHYNQAVWNIRHSQQ